MISSEDIKRFFSAEKSRDVQETGLRNETMVFKSRIFCTTIEFLDGLQKKARAYPCKIGHIPGGKPRQKCRHFKYMLLWIHPQSLARELVTCAVIFQPCSMTHVVSFNLFFLTEFLIRRNPFVQFLL